jgi:hypothetical protein
MFLYLKIEELEHEAGPTHQSKFEVEGKEGMEF